MSEPPPSPLPNPDRLNGWKEIGAYLGKSGRTAIRWEKELGLPVHRIRTGLGEIVFASRAEIDIWQATRDGVPGDAAAEAEPKQRAEDLHFRGHRPKPRWLAGLAWGLLVPIVALGAWVIWSWKSKAGVSRTARRAPAGWRVEGGELRVFDSAKRLLWTHAFGFPLVRADFSVDDPLYGSRVALADLDADGRLEVLAAPPAQSGRDSQLYCFDSDGRLRFKHQPQRTVTFGPDKYSPPFGVSQFVLEANPGGRKVIWLVATHTLWFPAAVQKLTPQGEVLGEFWNAGHVAALQLTTVGGRRVVLVGATNNETRGGALALLDADNPSGSSPAATDAFQCRDCPAGTPLAYLVFPRMEIAREMDSRSYVTELRADPAGHMTVTVAQGSPVPGDPTPGYPTAYYTLDQGFRVVAAEVGDNYRQNHARLELLGRLDHRFGPQDQQELFPVLSWGGTRFVPVPRPEPATRPSG